mgnify:CR=1 FL=1
MSRKTKPGVYPLLALFIITVLVAACNKDIDKIGLDIQPPGDRLGLSFSDTISLVSYSLREDSVRTDELTLALLGSFFDPVFGKTTASIFTEINLSNVVLDFGTSPSIDSIVLSMAYRGHYGDSTTLQNIRVYELMENIVLDDAYYSNQKVEHYPDRLLGMVTTLPPYDSVMVDTVKMAPHLRIPLNNGGILATKLLGGSGEDFLNNENFKKFFKGLFVTAETIDEFGKGSLITFDLLTNLSNLTVYYRNNSGDSLRYIFYITNASARFSHYEHYEYADASELFRQQVISGDTALGQNIIYVQPLGGVRTHLKIPALETLGQKIRSGELPVMSVNEAKIIFSNFDPDQTLEPPLRLVLAKITDNTGQTTLLDDQREGEAYFGGFYRKSDSNYSFRITRYVQKRLLNPDEEDFGLALMIPGASSVAQRALLNGGGAGPMRIRLEITYTEVH